MYNAPGFAITVSPGCLSCFLCPLFFQNKFPPNIYYKIRIYRNILDLFAFSPWDYMSMDLQQPLLSNIDNTVGKEPADNVKDGVERTCGCTDNWYMGEQWMENTQRVNEG